jgi:hypothetical protein
LSLRVGSYARAATALKTRAEKTLEESLYMFRTMERMRWIAVLELYLYSPSVPTGLDASRHRELGSVFGRERRGEGGWTRELGGRDGDEDERRRPETKRERGSGSGRGRRGAREGTHAEGEGG